MMTNRNIFRRQSVILLSSSPLSQRMINDGQQRTSMCIAVIIWTQRAAVILLQQQLCYTHMHWKGSFMSFQCTLCRRGQREDRSITVQDCKFGRLLVVSWRTVCCEIVLFLRSILFLLSLLIIYHFICILLIVSVWLFCLNACICRLHSTLLWTFKYYYILLQGPPLSETITVAGPTDIILLTFLWFKCH